ncbi:hypothetical protein ABI125_15100 [Tamlana crocina]
MPFISATRFATRFLSAKPVVAKAASSSFNFLKLSFKVSKTALSSWVSLVVSKVAKPLNGLVNFRVSAFEKFFQWCIHFCNEHNFVAVKAREPIFTSLLETKFYIIFIFQYLSLQKRIKLVQNKKV